MELMHFEYGTKNKKDIKYWAKYGARFGFKHLVTDPMTLVQMHDIDIKLMVISVLILVGYFIKRIVK
jgi:hypothetical protein